MEIERKFLVSAPPTGYRTYESHKIQQAYLCTSPVVRIRREDSSWYLTYKGKGLLAREEYNLPLTEEAYEHLLSKADGNILTKTRYFIPLADPVNGSASAKEGLVIELDLFEGKFQGLILAEVEFSDEETALSFTPPDWFGEDVTFSGEYQNSRLSQL